MTNQWLLFQIHGPTTLLLLPNSAIDEFQHPEEHSEVQYSSQQPIVAYVLDIDIAARTSITSHLGLRLNDPGHLQLRRFQGKTAIDVSWLCALGPLAPFHLRLEVGPSRFRAPYAYALPVHRIL